jgi:hypothetical protein
MSTAESLEIIPPLQHPFGVGKSLSLNVAVVPHFSWPNVLVELPFDGHRIFVAPEADELVCRAAVLAHEGISFEAGGTILRGKNNTSFDASNFRISENIAPGSSATWIGGRDYNQFVDPH